MEFTALRQTPKEDATTSIELLDIGYHHSSMSTTASHRIQPKPTLRAKLQDFPWRVFTIISLLPLCLAPIIILSAIAEMASQNYIRGRACYPNGLWKEAAGATWRIMDSTYFFTPNLSFGALAFTQVKIIDIAWDLVVGRGGQLCLAWVNYRIFNEWLVYHLERYRTSYKMFASVALQTTSLTTLGVLGKEFLCFGERSWGRLFRWLALLSMFISTFYVLAFPTLMAAMTGYITTYEPYVEDYDHNLIEWGKVEEVARSISGADWIGFDEQNVWVTAQDEALLHAVDELITKIQTPVDLGQANMSGSNPTFTLTPGTFWEFENVSMVVSNPNTTITTYLSTGKPLSDTAHGEQYYTISGRYGDQYNSSYIRTHSSCKPSETYQWGFSYIFLFMVSIFNFIWSVIMVGMWLDTRRGSRMYKSGRRPGLLRSVLDLAAAVREELGAEADYMEEEELRDRLKSSGGALIVPKEELMVRRTGTGELRTRKRTWKSDLTRGSTF